MPATVDIFNSVPLLIFPYNEGRYHRVFFTVNLLTLQQSFYDSFHGQIDRFLQCINISLCIKQSLIEYHQLRARKKHFLHEQQWSHDLVKDNSRILGNIKQQVMSVDCILRHCQFCCKSSCSYKSLGIQKERRNWLAQRRGGEWCCHCILESCNLNLMYKRSWSWWRNQKEVQLHV